VKTDEPGPLNAFSERDRREPRGAIARYIKTYRQAAVRPYRCAKHSAFSTQTACSDPLSEPPRKMSCARGPYVLTSLRP